MTKNPEKTFTAEEQNEIREQVREIMATEGLTQAEIARQADIKYGTFTGWLGGSYQGNNDKIAGEVQIWLISREEKKKTVARLAVAPDFQETETAKRITSILRFAQTAPDLVVVAGGAGIGKTTTLHHYAAHNPNVWIATMDPSTASIHSMSVELAEVLSVSEKSPARIPRALSKRVEGTGGLLIIDEAQHLDSKSMDQLRSIHDRARIGVALVGNETIYSRLEGEGRKPQFAQLFSRIGMRMTQARPIGSDICSLINAWGVVDKEEIKFLKAIARKPGALRGMSKTLSLATTLANGEGVERTLVHLRAAWEMLSTTNSTT